MGETIDLDELLEKFAALKETIDKLKVQRDLAEQRANELEAKLSGYVMKDGVYFDPNDPRVRE